MQLRRSIQEIASGAKSLDPDVALNARKVGLARGKLTEAVAATLPDDIGTAWQNARTAFATEIAGPKRALRTVLNRNTTPAQAFESVFASNDPHVFRTLMHVAEKSPAVKTKLRLGVLDTLDEASAGFKESKAALTHLDALRPMIETNKLFPLRSFRDLIRC